MYIDEVSQIQTLEESFEKIREAGWDTDQDLLWGYFFVDKNVPKLRKLGDHLESLDYRFVDIFELEDEDEGPSGDYMLHVERVEVHHPTSLAERNVALSRLASHWDVADYDGWEVGPVEPPTAN
jgi:Regulator of ribonuclease activity B